ncbi:MAG: hypothetical protein KDI17_18680 [Halioglobus sp.]|nr:hypothetical protein [Halioglobus sp.]
MPETVTIYQMGAPAAKPRIAPGHHPDRPCATPPPRCSRDPDSGRPPAREQEGWLAPG